MAALAAVLLAALPLIGGSAAPGGVRPGDTAPAAQLEIVMKSELIFPSALSDAAAGIENPKGSPFSLRYTLSLPRQELLRAAGISLPGEGEVLLYESPLLRPGEGVESLRLSALPGGELLPAGDYRAVMTVRPEGPGGMAAGEIALELPLRVMVSRLEMAADERGLLDHAHFNAAGTPARFLLALDGEKVLAFSDEIAPGGRGGLRLCRTAGGEAPPPGLSEAWLIRLAEGEAPAALARVSLRLPALRAESLPRACGLPAAETEMEQAIVNARYLLSFE